MIVEKYEEMNFEEAMQKLGILSDKIERGELSLDEAMEIYQQALELVKICNTRLTAAEQQVKLIVEKEGGTTEITDFKPMDGDKNA